MNIPINSNFTFTIKVLAEDSFLPQDLESLTDSRFVILTKSSTPTVVIGTEVVYEKIGTTVTDVTGDTNGYIKTTYDKFTDTTTTTVTYTDGLWSSTNTPAPVTVDEHIGTEGTTVTPSFFTVVGDPCDKDSEFMDNGTEITTTVVHRTTNSGILTIVLNAGTIVDGGTVTVRDVDTSVVDGYDYGTKALTNTNAYSAAEDGFFSKSTYKGSLVLSFDNRSDINVIIDDITAIDIGA